MRNIDTAGRKVKGGEGLSALSKKELIDRIGILQARIDELTTPPHNDWHAWFYALLRIVFKGFDSISIEREVMLGVQAPRADFIVVNEDRSVDLRLQIFAIFGRHNVAEFKSPDDALGLFTIWKGIGYIGFYINHMKEKGIEISASEVTLSFFRESRPEALFKELRSFIVEGPAKGIYYIKGWIVDIPIQIVVTKELKGDEYAGFRAISRKPKAGDVAAFIREHGDDSEISTFVRTYADSVSKVDSRLLEELKGRYPEMGKTLLEIMQPEINEVVNNTTRTNLYLYVKDGAMSIDYAARQAKLSVDDFRSQMNEFINSHKENAQLV